MRIGLCSSLLICSTWTSHDILIYNQLWSVVGNFEQWESSLSRRSAILHLATAISSWQDSLFLADTGLPGATHNIRPLLSGKHVKPGLVHTGSSAGSIIHQYDKLLQHIHVTIFHCERVLTQFGENRGGLWTNFPCLPCRFLALVAEGWHSVTACEGMKE